MPEAGESPSMTSGKFSGCSGVLFDFGGTLDAAGDHWLDRFFALYRKAGLDLPQNEIKRAFYFADELCCADPRVDALGFRALMHHHVGLQFTALDLEAPEICAQMADDFCRQSEFFLHRNARLLRRAKLRFRMGLVSNFYGNVAVICEETGLAGSLDVILDSGRFGKGKPDAEIFLAALDALSLPPEHVIFVGDSYERDMVPARALGMKTVWLKGPNPRIPIQAEAADACIFRLTELERLIA